MGMHEMAWALEESREAIIPLLALREEIEKRTAIRPTAMMLPLSLAPGATEVFGLPVIRGDRAALIYEPPKERL